MRPEWRLRLNTLRPASDSKHKTAPAVSMGLLPTMLTGEALTTTRLSGSGETPTR